MRLLSLLFFCLLRGIFGFGQPNSDTSGYRDIYPDTWVGTDALGRKMKTYEDVGPIKKDQRRVVGIFYVTWHRDSKYKVGNQAYDADVTKILKNHPEARLNRNDPAWGSYHTYHSAEPENGYFLSKDRYVIRKDMSMLSDAGVDVVILDVTNAVMYWDEWSVVLSVMEKMRKEGNKVPKFCFWAFNGPVITVVQHLYEQIYKKKKFNDLWFYWNGKPLLLYNGSPATHPRMPRGHRNPNPNYDPDAITNPNNPHYKNEYYTQRYYTDYTQEVKDFFTLRTMWWGYYEWQGKRFVGTEDTWSFGLDLGDPNVRGLTPFELVSTHNGEREEFPVTPAQHATTLIGRSWTKKGKEPPLNEYDLPVSAYVPWLGKAVSNPQAYGIYFQQRWNAAFKAKPQFIYLNDWNEWTAGKYASPKGKTYSFMRRRSNFRFVDQYNTEFSRAISPMKGGYTDNYYMQMVMNIRRYKGVRPIPELRVMHHMKIDGKFNEWNSVNVEYRDTRYDTFHRNYNGYGWLHYTNNYGRNDIITSKVAIDKKNIYFYAETDTALTPYTGDNWMLLFIDADRNSSTGWWGYDYLINKDVCEKTTSLMRYNAKTSNWVEVDRLQYAYHNNELEIAVPRSILGLKGRVFSFDFHWSDHPKDLRNQISLCTHGDSAPNRRFNYRCKWKNLDGNDLISSEEINVD